MSYNSEPPQLILDDRVGSRHLEGSLTKLGAVVKVRRLPFADVAFVGEGEGGRPVRVGVELKATGDLLRCIADGRFAGGQLLGLLEHYDVVYLLVEGEWRRAKDGTLLIPTRGLFREVTFGDRLWMHDAVMHWLQTMEELCGIRLRRTDNEAETAEHVVSLARWWDRRWSSHNAHLQLDESRRLPKRRNKKERPDLVKPTTLRQVANVLPGIGWRRSATVAKHFASVRAMVNSTVADWLQIPGIGKTTAARVIVALKETK